jgi:preprotein translocase subunit SecG
MYTLAIVLIFIVCILLVLIVLVQNSKGGGLASSFSNNNQIMGVRRTADFLEKATWYLAGSLLILCVMASAFIPRGQTAGEESIISRQVETAADPSAIPSFPMTQDDIETAGQNSSESESEE